MACDSGQAGFPPDRTVGIANMPVPVRESSCPMAAAVSAAGQRTNRTGGTVPGFSASPGPVPIGGSVRKIRLVLAQSSIYLNSMNAHSLEHTAPIV